MVALLAAACWAIRMTSRMAGLWPMRGRSRLLQLRLEARVLRAEGVALQRLVDHHLEMRGIQRFGDEVVGSRPHGVDGTLGGSPGGDDDHRGVDPFAPDTLQDFQATHARQLEVEQRDGRRFLAKDPEGFLAVVGALHLEPHETEAVRKQIQEIGIVVHHQDAVLSKVGHGQYPWAARVAAGTDTSAAGSVNANRLPRPTSLSTRIRPP